MSACAVVLPPTLGVAFLSYYGGFVVMMLFAFIGAVLYQAAGPASPASGKINRWQALTSKS